MDVVLILGGFCAGYAAALSMGGYGVVDGLRRMARLWRYRCRGIR